MIYDECESKILYFLRKKGINKYLHRIFGFMQIFASTNRPPFQMHRL